MRFVGPTFTLDVPTDWFVLSAPQYQTTFLSPQAKEGWRASFIITLRALDQNETPTPREFIEAAMAAYRAAGETHDSPTEVLETGTLPFGDMEGHYGRVQFADPQTGQAVCQTVAVAFYREMAHVFSATRVADGDAALLDKVDAIFEQMFASLRFQEARLEA
jgi:hypothetical protein